jgi:hypothetical protein
LLATSTKDNKIPIMQLSSYEEIKNIGVQQYTTNGQHGFTKHIHHHYGKQHSTKKSIQYDLYPTKLRLPTNDMMITRPDRNSHNHDTHHDQKNYTTSGPFQESPVTDPARDMDGSIVYVGKNKPLLAMNDHEENDGMFQTEINWATTNNPDGVPIVHTPIDQVEH